MKYLLSADRVLAGSRLDEIRNGAVVTEDEKILFAGDLETAREQYHDAKEMRFPGKTLMPGLFECHGHLAMDARVEGHLAMMELGACEHTVMAIKNLKDDLMAGITTERCLGDRHYIDVTLKEQVKEGKVEGPDLLVCGIGMRGVHGHGFVGVPHSGVEEFRRTARENMHRGVDVLKIFVTPGAPAPTPESFIPCFLSYDEISTVVEEAHRMGIRTAAHCIGGLGLDYCVKAGVDVIEHVYSITPEQVKMVEEEHKGWIDMTSGIVLDAEREPYLPDSQVQKMRSAREYSRQCLNLVYQSGKIPYTIGTDANHALLWRELVYAVEGGSPALDALKAVTVTAAQMCGVEKQKGQLTAGWNADVIAVEGNPLDDVTALKDVSFVMKAGKICRNDSGQAAGQRSTIID